MKTFEEILAKDFNIDSTTKGHNYQYLYQSILKAGKAYAEQAIDRLIENYHQRYSESSGLRIIAKQVKQELK